MTIIITNISQQKSNESLIELQNLLSSMGSYEMSSYCIRFEASLLMRAERHRFHDLKKSTIFIQRLFRAKRERRAAIKIQVFYYETHEY